MSFEDQLEICSFHYNKWKNAALAANDKEQVRRNLERAFFWLELQTAFIALDSVEKVQGKDPKVKNKILIAKTNLSKKLANYANEVMDDLKM
jgi:hypothetical protein